MGEKREGTLPFAAGLGLQALTFKEKTNIVFFIFLLAGFKKG